MNKFIFLITFLLFVSGSQLRGQKVEYPHPLSFITLQVEKKPVRMAYMDIAPATLNGKTILLFHGKNFNGFYWKDVISALVARGYRVIVPDQVGS